MKKILLLLLLTMAASLAARADVYINTTNFPDAKFPIVVESTPEKIETEPEK